MTDSPQSPEAVALALTRDILQCETAPEMPDREYILSLYEECLQATKGHSRNKDEAKKYKRALEEMHG